jgi:hypothetical protein
VRLELIERTKPGATGRTFELMVTGVAGKPAFEVWAQRVIGEPYRLSDSDFILGESGRLAQPRPNEKYVDYLQLTLHEFFLGEPLRLWIISTDGRVAAKTSVIPYPLESRDPNAGYVLTAELVDKDGLYSVTATGFATNEEVECVITMSGREVSRDKRVITGAGVMWILDPRMVGAQGGTSSLTVIGERGRVSLDLPWGSQMQLKGELPRPAEL